MSTTYEKARALGMFDDLICPQESCGAAMKVAPEAVDIEKDGTARYDCPSCGVSDCLGEDVMREYIEDQEDGDALSDAKIEAHINALK